MLTIRMARGAVLLSVAALATALACGGSLATTPTGTVPQTITVSFPGGTLVSEIAYTTAQRDSGLMNRTTLGANIGMVFAYPYTQQPEFEAYWMQNTPIALSIAFLDSTKKVINIEDMQPNTTTLHFATGRFLYAIEANLGWFASHNVAAGTTATFSLPAGVVPTQ